MNQNPIIFNDAIAQNYDAILGPFVFEPYAIDILERIDFTGVQNVLEIASGTGRVTKHLAANLPVGAQLIATDLNPGMLAVASQVITADTVEWKIADMMALPFEDETFDLVVCQFGVMFAPDKLGALKEIRRVLKKGGILLFNTWGPIEENPVWHITSTIVNELMGEKASRIFKDGPFNLDDVNVVLGLLELAGFEDTTATTVLKTGESSTAALAAKGFIEGLPIVKVIKDNTPELLLEILSRLESEFIGQLGGNPVKSKLNALVFQSKK